MDALLLDLKDLSVMILPSLGVTTLIFILVILRQVYLLLKRVDKTLDRVDETLNEISKPIKTLSNITKTIDAASALAQHSLLSITKLLVDNFEMVKEYVGNFLKGKSEDEHFYDPEDQDAL